MDQQTLFTALLSSSCAATSAALSWVWYLPIIQQLSQQPIESCLKRAADIGFNEQKLRKMLFTLEVLLMATLIWFGWAYMGLFLGLTVIAVLYHVRGLLLSWIIEGRERTLRSQTLSFTTGLQGLVRGGLSLSQAVDLIARETPAPLGIQVARVATDFRRGRPLVESLNDVRSTLRLDAFSLLVTSICCALKQGSSLENSLKGVQETLEHREHAERHLSAKTSGARSTLLILALTPLGFFFMFWVMQPESMNLIFMTPQGKAILAIVVGLMYVGIAWAKKVITIK